jgi:hypothetical protein
MMGFSGVGITYVGSQFNKILGQVFAGMAHNCYEKCCGAQSGSTSIRNYLLERSRIQNYYKHNYLSLN